MTKNKIQNGEVINLKRLLTGDNKIIIPDLQRDYTWGDKKHGKDNRDLVTGFVENLFEVFNKDKNKAFQLGLIYAYEEPENFINIADGQQRLTTLFLLLGVLYRNMELKNKDVKDCLMSDFEENDDREPRLQYAIRESTLYFLSDLTYHYFINKEEKSIKDSVWYYNEYNLDPSIQSMLSAIDIIEKQIKIINDKENFAKWIIENIQFFYFDMGSRSKGEETFVIINTTGEPLTATENLKPLLLGDIKDGEKRKEASQIWEKWEKYFWQNRKKNEYEADNGLNQFLTWYWQIQLLQEKEWKDNKPYDLNINNLFKNKPEKKQNSEEIPTIEKWEESIKVEKVEKYFKALEILLKNLNSNKKIIDLLKNIKKIENKVDLTWLRNVEVNVTLPLIAYIKKFNNPKYLYDFIKRLCKNYYNKKWEDRNNNYVDWRHIIQIINLLDKEEDILKYRTIENENKFKKIANVKLNEWYNEEEKIKDKLKQEHKEKIEKWEDYNDFMGDISILFRAYLVNENDDKIPEVKNIEYDIKELERIYNNYQVAIGLLKEKGKNKEEIEISNLFRLFRLFSGIVIIEHFYKTSWNFRGVKFSTYNRKHFEKIEFIKLIKNENIVNYCIKYIKQKIEEEELFSESYDEYNYIKLLKAWLTLKVFNANYKNVVLEYWDENDTGVAACTDINNNRLTTSYKFSLENSICGFAKHSSWGRASYIHYTQKENWLKPNIIDTPFAGIRFQKFEDIEIDKRQVEIGEIDENKKKIEEIIEYINSL